MEGRTTQGLAFGSMHGVQRGWCIHATVYVAVNLLLVLLAFLHGRTPMLAPALGWGLGLAIHGMVALLVAGSGRRVARL